MKLVVDCREKELIKQINQQVLFTPQFKKIKIVIENLPIGDILIKNDDDEDELIIERKTISDLLSSIKDGRYDEQSYRLNGIAHHNHNVIYLIEGDTNNKKFFQKIDKLTFYSALLSLNYYKGFSVIKTQNLTETAIFICNSLLKIEKSTNKKPYYTYCQPKLKSNLQSELNQGGSLIKTIKTEVLEITTIEEEKSEEKDYVHVVKKIKKENITTGNIDEIMLSQVPGISSTIAIAIIGKFKSVKQIIDKYNMLITNTNTNTTQEQKDAIIKEMFNDIFYINSKGDKRKITKTSMINLYKFLLENK
jgi:ERCC4-type nuclease